MTTAPFPVDPVLTAVAIAYRNEFLVADGVMPRVPVARQEFKWWEYALSEGFSLPDTRVGRKSRPTEVEFGAVERSAVTEDYGLDDAIPQSDVDNAPANFDPRAQASQRITDLILLDREVRVAGIVQNPSSYAADNVRTLSGSERFDDFAGSDPLETILDALDGCIVRPNVMVIGRSALSVLARHPKVVRAHHGNDGDSGIVPRLGLAQIFDLQEVLVGEAFLNRARPGQPVDLARVWGPNVALVHRNPAAGAQGGLTWGFTAQFGDRVAGTLPDSDIGLRGGVRVRVGESVKEVVAAPDAGALLRDVIG